MATKQSSDKGVKRKSSGKAKSQPKKSKNSPNSSDYESDLEQEHEAEVPFVETTDLLEETEPKLPKELLQTYYKTPGCLLISGMVAWDSVGGNKKGAKPRTLSNLYVFNKFTDRKYRFIASSPAAAHSILITESGQVYIFGRNSHGQLGLGDTNTRDEPTEVSVLKNINIIYAATGRHHSLFLSDAGVVYACGDNSSGQCGIGTLAKKDLLLPAKIKYNGDPIVRIGCGADFSMILDMNGKLHSFGMPEYGQLGNNTEGKYFVTSTKMTHHFELMPKMIDQFVEKDKSGRINKIPGVEIVSFSCGNNHTVAIDARKRAFSWGFGGFGRLGHAEQKNEMVPRLIKSFEAQSRGVRSVHCGNTYSLAVNDLGALYMFGQTKRTGDANMYPKPVHDLAGWNIHCVGTSNSSVVLTADDAVIAWGSAPTYGELGLGELQKSSSKPIEVQRMDGMKISQIAMGFSHTLMLCDDSTEEVQAKLAKMPTFKP